MRLLRPLPAGDFELTTFDDDTTLPPFAILSHCWSAGAELTYPELVTGGGRSKPGFEKLRFCGRLARADGLEYFWIDTCCIDKSTNNELSTAINSMFRYYSSAVKCYVYLADVESEEDFGASRWFTRGWTLQELLAPRTVEFFSKEGELLGTKLSLESEISRITGIPGAALRGRELASFSVEERMGWAKTRTTTLKEDKAYCLLGIFGVFLPLIYGEGEAHALLRLQEEIERRQKEQELKPGIGGSFASEFCNERYLCSI